MSVHSKMTAIASAIRDKTGGTDPLTLDGMAEAIPQVFETGNQAGEDTMWDGIQDYGNKTDYRCAFFYTGFTHIDPKWQIKANNADSIFCGCNKLESANWEKIDLSATSSLYSAFAFNTKLTEVDTDLCVLNANAASLLNSIFRSCFALQRVKKITAFPSAVWKNSFDNCTALTHILFDGTIGANGLNLQWSTGLDRESIESIIHALSDTTTGLSITLSETAVYAAFPPIYEGDEFVQDDVEWLQLINTKSNWTINLV